MTKKKIVSESPIPVPGSAPSPVVSKPKIEFGFPEAIQAVIGGKSVRRIEWADADEFCLLRDSFLMIHKDNKYHTWIVSEGDLMAIDWVII